MIGVLSILIEPLAKALLKAWLGETASEIGGGLIKYARDVLRDSRKAADAARHVLAMATTLARDLESAMADEGLDEQVVEPAAAELAETIHRHFDTAITVGAALEPQTLEQALLSARPIETFYVPSEPEAAAYRHLVSLLAPRLCELAPDLPDYARLRDSVLLARMAETARDAIAILAKVGAMQQAVARFGGQVEQLAGSEQRRKLAYLASYRRAVREELDFVEILGLSELASHQREARLSVAYLSLTTSADDIGRLGTEELLDLLPLLGRRLLIEGPAGSGKSTLLRWAAVRAADSDEPPEERDPWQLWRCAMPDSAEHPRELSLRDLLQIATGRLSRPDTKAAKGDGESLFHRMTFHSLLGRVWRHSIPFQIRLRHVRGGLPGPDLLPAHLSSALGAPPEHWVRDLLEAGHAMLLIDGVDEVPEGEPRQAAMAGIRSYVAQYPACLFVAASRPGACDVPLLRQLGFVQATIDELSEDQRNAFIDNWHQAYASKRDRPPSNRDTARVAAALKTLLANQPRLGRLATNPLLCSAICALHERDRDALPRSEWDLCDKLTRMLAEQRDRSAGRQGSVGIDQFGPAYRLDYAIRRNVLSRLAEAMTGQQLSALPRDEAIEHVAETLSRSRAAEGLSAEEVLDALIARSGVVRASSVVACPESGAQTRDAVEFVHNTLKSWLASLHCLQLNKPRAGGRRTHLRHGAGCGFCRRRADASGLCGTPDRGAAGGCCTSHRSRAAPRHRSHRASLRCGRTRAFSGLAPAPRLARGCLFSAFDLPGSASAIGPWRCRGRASQTKRRGRCRRACASLLTARRH